MGQVQSALAILGALVALAAIAGGLFAYAKSGAQDIQMKRLREERDDYLSRINYIEPRLTAMEEQNHILLKLTDPTEGIKSLGVDHSKIIDILERQEATLGEIAGKVHPKP